MEIDEYDACEPVYVLQKGDDGRLRGCVRLVPTTGPTMLRDTFPALLGGEAVPTSETVWESSRFGVKLIRGGSKSPGGIAKATYELFAGVLEFGLSRGLSDIVTVTDVRMERILCRARWPVRRLGRPGAIGNTIAVAGYLEISREVLAHMLAASGLETPVICTAESRAARSAA